MSKRRKKNAQRKRRRAPAAPAATARTRRGSKDPARVTGLMNDARALKSAGQIRQAEQVFEQVLAIDPNNDRALFSIGQIKGILSEFEASIRYMRQAVKLQPDSAVYHAGLAESLLQSRDAVAAVECAKRAIRLDPRHFFPYLISAMCLERTNELDEAAKYCEQALDRQPRHPGATTLLAEIYRRLKRLDDAEALLDDLLREPRPPMHWSEEQKALHDRAMLYDAQRQYEEAHKTFAHLADLVMQSPRAHGIDREAPYRTMRIARESITSRIAPHSEVMDLDDKRPQPNFLVGFPRSGTTMTEQILAAHPAMVTTDELELIGMIGQLAVDRLGGHPAQYMDRFDVRLVQELRAAYWRDAEKALGESITDRVFLDKLPLNIMSLWLINLVFPKAKVIVALRDPRDVCLSNFMQYYDLTTSIANLVRLDDTVRFYAAVMGWYIDQRELISIDSIQVRYEDTVTALEQQARRMLDFLELDWSDEVSRFHEKARERYISTPSWQAVTEPTHTRAIGRWKNYAHAFEPHQATLAPFLEDFGYTRDVV